MAAPRHTSVDRDALLSAIREGTVSFGDGTGAWAGTAAISDSLWINYGRATWGLDDLAGEGVVRRHPSGADYWQIVGEA